MSPSYNIDDITMMLLLVKSQAKGVWTQSHKDNSQERPPDFSYKWLYSTLKRHGIVMTSPKAVEPVSE